MGGGEIKEKMNEIKHSKRERMIENMKRERVNEVIGRKMGGVRPPRMKLWCPTFFFKV
jgi:hypothetical protein